MPLTITPQEFIDNWRRVELKEHSASQEHFIDPKGDFFTFEYGLSKQKGDDGSADVLSNVEILERLLAFNLERAGR